jgi:hypothetical protein
LLVVALVVELLTMAAAAVVLVDLEQLPILRYLILLL